MVRMKPPMIMLIDDDPIADATMALAKEQHDRTSEFGRLCNAGHVRVLKDESPATITCMVEDEEFTEERTRFPSTTLMARLQLAIAAGRSCNNLPRDANDHAVDAMRYAAAYDRAAKSYGGASKRYLSGLITKKPVSREDLWMEFGDPRSEAVAQGYHNVKPLTATVKKLKGVRP